MGVLERVYDHSPIFLQNIMTTVSGYQRNSLRYGKEYYHYREFLTEFDTWALERKLEYQRVELINFLHYAVKSSRFYRELYRDINLELVQSIGDLRLLPIVDKEVLRQNIGDVMTISREGAVEGHTGGTTGKSLVVRNTQQDSMRRMAMLDHFKARVGFEHRKMKRATFNGKHIIPPDQKEKVFWRYNAACKQMIYSSFHLTEVNMGSYVQSLNRFKPQAIDGFFMSMCDMASYIERHNIKVGFRPKAIFPTSETLTQSGRELLERVFNCKVYDQYASSEGAPFVTECPHQTLHMELASGVFEHLDEESNEILITSFTTHGTPLIRYRIGDSMIFDKGGNQCSCGLAAPIVQSIQGRGLDFLFAADGAKISAVNVANMFKNVPNALIRVQTVQDRLGEIIIRLEVDKQLYKPDYDDLLREEFVHKFGRDTEVVIEHVDEIPREKSGKFRLIRNNIISDIVNEL